MALCSFVFHMYICSSHVYSQNCICFINGSVKLMWLSGDCILVFIYFLFWRPISSNYTWGWVKKILSTSWVIFFRLQRGRQPISNQLQPDSKCLLSLSWLVLIYKCRHIANRLQWIWVSLQWWVHLVATEHSNQLVVYWMYSYIKARLGVAAATMPLFMEECLNFSGGSVRFWMQLMSISV